MAVFLSLLIFLTMFVFRVMLLFSYTPDLGGVENTFVYSIQKMLIGKPLYSNPEDFNFDITQYTPVFYYFLYVFYKLLGLQAGEDLMTIYIVGRSIVLLINCLTIYFIYHLAVKRLAINPRISLIIAIFSFVYLTANSLAIKSDALFHLVFLLFGHFTLKYIETNVLRYLFYASLIACLSIFVKQSGIQLPIILVDFFFLHFQWKGLTWAVIFLAILIVPSFTIFDAVYGAAFWQNTFGGVISTIDWLSYYKLWINHIFPNFQILFIGSFFLIFVYFNPQTMIKEKFLIILSVGSFLFAAATATRRGAGANYFADFVHIALLCFAYFGQAAFQYLEKRKSKITQYSHLLLLSAVIVLLPYKLINNYFHFAHFDIAYKNNYQQASEVANFLKQELKGKTHAYFFSFDAHLNNLLVENSLLPNNDIFYFGVIYDYTRFKEGVANGKIAYIVLESGSVPTSYQGADFSKFKLIKELNRFSVFAKP